MSTYRVTETTFGDLLGTSLSVTFGADQLVFADLMNNGYPVQVETAFWDFMRRVS